ncbi:MAG: NAD(P)-binding protein [Polyangiaceae bacterium]
MSSEPKAPNPLLLDLPPHLRERAGLSGCFAARTLADHGLAVTITVFEKSRGLGGRMATRRHESQGQPSSFDHGAQYFTVRDERFRRYVAVWQERSIVAPWEGRIAVLGGDGQRDEPRPLERFVGTPNMPAICHHLAVGCLVSDDHAIVACGDWASGARVEGAFLSGGAAAGRVLGTRQALHPTPRQGELFS